MRNYGAPKPPPSIAATTPAVEARPRWLYVVRVINAANLQGIARDMRSRVLAARCEVHALILGEPTQVIMVCDVAPDGVAGVAGVLTAWLDKDGRVTEYGYNRVVPLVDT